MEKPGGGSADAERMRRRAKTERGRGNRKRPEERRFQVESAWEGGSPTSNIAQCLDKRE